MYSWNWAALEVARLDVLKPLLPDGMDDEEGAPAHTVALVVEVCVCDLSLHRTIAVMTEDTGKCEPSLAPSLRDPARHGSAQQRWIESSDSAQRGRGGYTVTD